MIVVTTETVPGYEVSESLGLVRGNVVRTKHIGSDIVAAIRNIIGGEVREYTQMISGAREQAMDRMLEDARSKGADGVVCVRFSTSMVVQGAAEMLAYGTAVKLRPVAE